MVEVISWWTSLFSRSSDEDVDDIALVPLLSCRLVLFEESWHSNVMTIFLKTFFSLKFLFLNTVF